MATQPARHNVADTPYVFAQDIIDAAMAVSRGHPHAARVARAYGDDPMLAEAVHFFSLLHAERPSVASIAGEADRQIWLSQFDATFDGERAWLARAAVQSGPPRRHDLSRHELLVYNQREAMLTLARSDRAGCALGAVAALACDWPGVRAALSRDASPGIDPRVADALAAAATSPTARRAIGFGCAQMLAVHRTLWDLLEARQAASLP